MDIAGDYLKKLNAPSKFTRAAMEYLTSLGARDATPEDYLGGMYEVVLDTDKGPLLIHARDSEVMCRFADVSRLPVASSWMMFRPNPYTGKWNLHFSKRTAFKMKMDRLKAHIPGSWVVKAGIVS